MNHNVREAFVNYAHPATLAFTEQTNALLFPRTMFDQDADFLRVKPSDRLIVVGDSSSKLEAGESSVSRFTILWRAGSIFGIESSINSSGILCTATLAAWQRGILRQSFHAHMQQMSQRGQQPNMLTIPTGWIPRQPSAERFAHPLIQSPFQYDSRVSPAQRPTKWTSYQRI